MLIRNESRSDRAAIHAVNTAAFETPSEAELVNALREQAQPIVSLVAEMQDRIVGHILFSPVVLPGFSHLKIMGLAPMAVIPDYQRSGVGSALVRTGLEQCRKLGCGAVVVLGHPGYYPRFGFHPAADASVGCEYEAPPEAFMLLELEPGYLSGAAGTVRYHAAFNDL